MSTEADRLPEAGDEQRRRRLRVMGARATDLSRFGREDWEQLAELTGFTALIRPARQWDGSRRRNLNPPPRPDWMEEASCAEQPIRQRIEAGVVDFFPARGASAQAAKEICAACPVRVPCFEFALEQPELRGIWGGATARRRAAERTRRALAAEARPRAKSIDAATWDWDS